jgi:hypothetical protein
MKGRRARPPAAHEAPRIDGQWRRAVERAWDGEPRLLLELLLQPAQEIATDALDAAGRRVWRAVYHPLPDDADLRVQIVRALMLGPWRQARSLFELSTRTGWGKGKPRLAEREVGAAEVLLRHRIGEGKSPKPALHELAHALGVQPDSLQRRIKSRRKRNV